jgi:hypothetical protein
VELAVKVFGPKTRRASCNFFYKDDEHDTIRIATNADLKAAFEHHQDGSKQFPLDIDVEMPAAHGGRAGNKEAITTCRFTGNQVARLKEVIDTHAEVREMLRKGPHMLEPVNMDQNTFNELFYMAHQEQEETANSAGETKLGSPAIIKQKGIRLYGIREHSSPQTEETTNLKRARGNLTQHEVPVQVIKTDKKKRSKRKVHAKRVRI